MSPDPMRYFASLRRPRGVTPILRAVALLLTVPLLAGCLLLEPVPTPQPVPTRSPSPTPTAASPSPTPSPTPQPTPGLADVPVFSAGDSAATAVGGLRLRTRPGLDHLVTAVLGPEVGVLIGVGPVFVDGQGWYLVRDPDRVVPPRFDEGWVAAGFEPDPFLVPADFEPSRNPYLAGFAGDRSGEFGPLRLPDDNVAIRWIAAALTPDGCSFSVDLTPVGGDAGAGHSGAGRRCAGARRPVQHLLRESPRADRHGPAGERRLGLLLGAELRSGVSGTLIRSRPPLLSNRDRQAVTSVP